MKIEVSFLRSKLARRIFWLFVVCAMVPIGLLAFVSLRDVMAQLNEQSRKQLRESTRDIAMTICQRLVFLEGDLKLIGEVLKVDGSGRLPAQGEAPPIPTYLSRPFRNVEFVGGDGQRVLVSGKTLRRVEFTKGEQTFLEEGKSVLSTMKCDGGEACIFLSRKAKTEPGSAPGTLVAELDATAFWDQDSLPQDKSLCVLDSEGERLFCSGPAPARFPSEITKVFSGEFEWKLDDKQFLARYWNLPLAGGYFTPHWTVVGSEAKVDVLAPLARFQTSYLLVALLTFWIVLLLSLRLIRRSLIPLGKLKEGTREIAAGNYKARVAVKSADEFEELAGSFNSMADRIERQMHSLRVANEIDRAILSAWDIQKVVSTLATRIGELIPLDLVSITLFEADHRERATTYVFDRRRNRPLAKHTIEVMPEELEKLAGSAGVSTSELDNRLASYSEPVAGEGMQSLLHVPILLEGRPAAVILLGRMTGNPWSEEDRENARQLGDQAGVALANSELIRKLNEVHWGSMSALARAIDAKSPWTLGHSERVTEFALRIAQAMGISGRELEVMRRGGLLHDIGKIGVPASILDKPGKLTPEELLAMQEHVNIGVRILQPVPGFAESMPIVAQHHEWLNGNGYPNKLKGKEITLHSRIFAVADCYDALISDRPYRRGMPIETAVAIIREGTGKQFDPEVVEVFEGIIGQQGNRSENGVVEDCGQPA